MAESETWRAIPGDAILSRWIAADGWEHRRLDRLPADAPARGSMVLQGGRGDFIEKYLEAQAHWHGRGWGMTSFDWRGQGGSGREPGDARSLDPMVADCAAFVAEWTAATPGPHVAVAHSMGGHLLLRALIDQPAATARLTAVVLVAPMLGLAAAGIPPMLARLIARTAARLGHGAKPIWRDSGRSALAGAARQANLTSSAERHADEAYWKRTDPALGMGAPSWGWLAAAFDSIASLDRKEAMESVRTPILLLATPHDRLVSTRAIVRAAARLPDAQLAMFDGAHELLREADPVRLAAFTAIDRFLDARAGGR